MGQDVGRTTFSRRDRQHYRAKVQRCLDALADDAARAPVRPGRADDRHRGRAQPGRRTTSARRSSAADVLRGDRRRRVPVRARPLEPRAQPAAAAAARATSGGTWSTSCSTSSRSPAPRPATAGSQLAVIGILPTLRAPPPRRSTRSRPTTATAAQRADARRSRRADPARHRRRRPVGPHEVGARAPGGRLRLDRARGGVHVDAAAPAGAPGVVRRLLERRAVPGGRAAGGRRELAVPARLAAVGGDPDPAVRAVLRRAHARSCATRACGRGCGSASGGSPRSSTCSRRTAATSRR